MEAVDLKFTEKMKNKIVIESSANSIFVNYCILHQYQTHRCVAVKYFPTTKVTSDKLC